MPSRIAATAADMPLFYQSFNSYAQAIAVKTAAHGLRVSLLPEIWALPASGRFLEPNVADARPPHSGEQR